MMVQSPLRKNEVEPNLRKVPKPDISSPSPKNKQASKRNTSGNGNGKRIPSIRPGRVILAAIIIGIFGFMYLTHVFATQQLLKEVQQLEKEYNNARQMHDELKLRYDRMAGPAEVYEKAKKQGFVNGGPADKVLVIEE